MAKMCMEYGKSCDKITDAVERNVPKMKTNMSKKAKPIWMTYKAQKAVKAKYNSWKTYKERAAL